MLEHLSRAIFFMDDFELFKNTQLKKYFSEKQSPVKKDSPEWDMISDIIEDYWCDLLASGYINNKNEQEKLKIFNSVTIVFPFLHIPISWLDGIDYVDFSSFLS